MISHALPNPVERAASRRTPTGARLLAPVGVRRSALECIPAWVYSSTLRLNKEIRPFDDPLDTIIMLVRIAFGPTISNLHVRFQHCCDTHLVASYLVASLFVASYSLTFRSSTSCSLPPVTSTPMMHRPLELRSGSLESLDGKFGNSNKPFKSIVAISHMWARQTRQTNCGARSVIASMILSDDTFRRITESMRGLIRSALLSVIHSRWYTRHITRQEDLPICKKEGNISIFPYSPAKIISVKCLTCKWLAKINEQISLMSRSLMISCELFGTDNQEPVWNRLESPIFAGN